MNNDCRDEFNRFMYGDEGPTTRFDVQKLADRMRGRYK